MESTAEVSKESRIRGYKEKYYANNMEKVKAAASAWKRENPGKLLARSRSAEGVAYRKAYHAAHYALNKEKIKARVIEWKKANREWAEAWRKDWWAKNGKKHLRARQEGRYGLAPGMISEMLKRQDNLCAICAVSLSPKFAVDHDHATGKVRGLLCPGCNLGLGTFKDSAKLLRLAAIYIWKFDLGFDLVEAA